METNMASRQSKGQLKVTIRAESDKDGSALRSTYMFPDNRSPPMNTSQLATSIETFGNRMNSKTLNQSMVMTDAVSPPLNNAADDDLDVDREMPREEKKFDMINSSHTLTTVNENPSDFNDTLHALNSNNN